jgi:N6-adenosine-specific RNA methylase IME4
MSEQEKSPTGQGRAKEVSMGKTNNPSTPNTQENSLIPLTRNKYGVIYADPPWSFRTWSAKGTGRGAISHYECLSFEALTALPIAELAARDCVLFLWAVDPHLEQAFELIRAWGFKYKTVGFYWVKQNKKSQGFCTGLGFWTRANPEQCLLATRGQPKRLGRDVRKLVIEPRREHSRKPDEVRDRIEQLVHGPYVELFARETKSGWDYWGDQAGLFDQGTVPTRRQPSRLIERSRCGEPLIPTAKVPNQLLLNGAFTPPSRGRSMLNERPKK